MNWLVPGCPAPALAKLPQSCPCCGMRPYALLLLCIGLTACIGPRATAPVKSTLSSFDRPVGKGAEQIQAGHIQFREADLAQVLDFYSDLSGRNVVLSPQVPPRARITLRNVTAISRIETLQ